MENSEKTRFPLNDLVNQYKLGENKSSAQWMVDLELIDESQNKGNDPCGSDFNSTQENPRRTHEEPPNIPPSNPRVTPEEPTNTVTTSMILWVNKKSKPPKEPTNIPPKNPRRTPEEIREDLYLLLVGLQRKIVLFIYESCKVSRHKTSPPIPIQTLTDACATSVSSVQRTIQLQVAIFMQMIGVEVDYFLRDR